MGLPFISDGGRVKGTYLGYNFKVPFSWVNSFFHLWRCLIGRRVMGVYVAHIIEDLRMVL